MQMPHGAVVPIMIRLAPADAKLLDNLARSLNAARPGTVAIALHHLAETLGQGQPIYPTRRVPGAGLASLTTPPPGLGAVLDGNKERVEARIRDRRRSP